MPRQAGGRSPGAWPVLALGVGALLGGALVAAVAWMPRSWSVRLSQLLSAEQPDRRYRVTVAGRRLAGVDRNISGLTFSHTTQTLFAVINRPEQVVEIDACGRVLRVLDAEFGDDLEAITHVDGDLFLIASERGNVIWSARIGAQTTSVEPASPRTLAVRFNKNKNEGLEALSWDHRGQRLFVANEKNPVYILEVEGVDGLLRKEADRLSISIWNPRFSLADLAGDLSSISFHERWNAMTVLSHESRRVYRFDDRSDPTLLLALERGQHGLRQRVEQPEGLAFGPDQSVFIVAEPNLFYRFQPRRPAGSPAIAGSAPVAGSSGDCPPD